MLRISLLIVALAFPLPAHAWPGTVLDVHDGDTMTVAGNVQNFSHIEWLNRLDASLSRVHRKFSC